MNDLYDEFKLSDTSDRFTLRQAELLQVFHTLQHDEERRVKNYYYFRKS
ncbi:TPA: hypothetical protein HA234_03075 [Candidatus Woesearchaeota archaeon]|nr:hypothetical protein [Candidatus Woesearchaeota archaeon]